MTKKTQVTGFTGVVILVVIIISIMLHVQEAQQLSQDTQSAYSDAVSLYYVEGSGTEITKDNAEGEVDIRANGATSIIAATVNSNSMSYGAIAMLIKDINKNMAKYDKVTVTLTDQNGKIIYSEKGGKTILSILDWHIKIDML